jgi:hypothetical protein
MVPPVQSRGGADPERIRGLTNQAGDGAGEFAYTKRQPGASMRAPVGQSSDLAVRVAKEDELVVAILLDFMKKVQRSSTT